MDLFGMLAVIYKYKKLYEKRCSGIMSEYDLRIADLDILYYVAHSGGRNLSRDIADMGMSKANVSRSVDHLRRKNLVILSEDREDRRCVHIETTAEAAALVKKIETVRSEMGRMLTRGVSQADEDAVKRVMHTMGANLEEMISS